MVTLLIVMNTLSNSNEIHLLISFLCKENWILPFFLQQEFHVVHWSVNDLVMNFTNRLDNVFHICLWSETHLFHCVTLQVLRHLGRISETRIGHHRVIILLKPQ